MPYYFIQWTYRRLEELAMNGVSPEDFEAVVMHPEYVETSRSTGRPIALGVDSTGELLACVYELDEDGVTLYPITAYYPDTE